MIETTRREVPRWGFLAPVVGELRYDYGRRVWTRWSGECWEDVPGSQVAALLAEEAS